MNLQTIEHRYGEELRGLHDAENQLLRALPRMTSLAAQTPRKSTLEAQAKEVEEHVHRLERMIHQHQNILHEMMGDGNSARLRNKHVKSHGEQAVPGHRRAKGMTGDEFPWDQLYF